MLDFHEMKGDRYELKAKKRINFFWYPHCFNICIEACDVGGSLGSIERWQSFKITLRKRITIVIALILALDRRDDDTKYANEVKDASNGVKFDHKIILFEVSEAHALVKLPKWKN